MKQGEVITENFDFEGMDPEKRNKLLIAALEWMAKQRRLPLDVYNVRRRAFPTVFVDVFTCVLTEAGWEIFLVERKPGEPFAGKHHVPGTTVMLRDSFGVAKKRTAEETCLLSEGDPLTFLGVIHMPKMHLEHAVVIAYVRILSEKPAELKDGAFHSLDNLPDSLIEHQRRVYFGLIRQALECAPQWRPVVVELNEPTE